MIAPIERRQSGTYAIRLLLEKFEQPGIAGVSDVPQESQIRTLGCDFCREFVLRWSRKRSFQMKVRHNLTVYLGYHEGIESPEMQSLFPFLVVTATVPRYSS